MKLQGLEVQRHVTEDIEDEVRSKRKLLETDDVEETAASDGLQP